MKGVRILCGAGDGDRWKRPLRFRSSSLSAKDSQERKRGKGGRGRRDHARRISSERKKKSIWFLESCAFDCESTRQDCQGVFLFPSSSCCASGANERAKKGKKERKEEKGPDRRFHKAFFIRHVIRHSCGSIFPSAPRHPEKEKKKEKRKKGGVPVFDNLTENALPWTARHALPGALHSRLDISDVLEKGRKKRKEEKEKEGRGKQRLCDSSTPMLCRRPGNRLVFSSHCAGRGEEGKKKKKEREKAILRREQEVEHVPAVIAKSTASPTSPSVTAKGKGEKEKKGRRERNKSLTS